MKKLNVFVLLALFFSTLQWMTPSTSQADDYLDLICNGQKAGNTNGSDLRTIIVATTLNLTQKQGTLQIRMKSASGHDERYTLEKRDIAFQYTRDGRKIEAISLGITDAPSINFIYMPQNIDSQGTLIVWNHTRVSHFGGIYKLNCRMI